MTHSGLPESGREVKEVGKAWRKGGGGDVRELLGAEATEGAFKAGALGKRVLHLATHGFFLEGPCPSALEGRKEGRPRGGLGPVTGENPLLLSGLAFAGANHRKAAGEGEEDGVLTAEEVAALDLREAELAVLSVCDTGVGEIKAGEGVFGLRRAFEVAGVGALVTSLWGMEDEGVRDWMRAFYGARYGKGMRLVESVREASVGELKGRRRRGESTHPAYWGGFVASGEWK